MKIIFLELLKGLLLGMCFVLFCLILATCSRSAYAVDLSKSLSVTPERHSGFFVPLNCIGSQSLHLNSASITAMQTRLHSLYEGMTQQNKSAMANMLGASKTARVNPLTSFKSGGTSQNSKVLGGNHHA
jgi:ABC-type oligopeptide transport system substrate-binding subunit